PPSQRTGRQSKCLESAGKNKNLRGNFHAWPQANRFSQFAYVFRRNWPRTRYRTDATANTTPVTTNSRAVAWTRIQRIATIASAGTMFIPGKLKGGAPSARTSRCTNTQQAAQQSRYINNTATLESTANFSKVPLIDSKKASAA